MTILTPVARLPLVTTELDALLRQVARRDVDAFATFYDRTRARVFGLVTRLGSVPPDDAEAFTKALTRLVAAPDELARMGAAGRRFVEGWASPEAVAEQYEQLFTELREHRR